MTLKSKFLSGFLVLTLLFPCEASFAAKPPTQIDIVTVRFALLATGLNLGRSAFEWLLASLSLTPHEPNESALDPQQRIEAHRALNTILTGQEEFATQQRTLYQRFQHAPVRGLVRIALRPSTPEKVRYVAQRALRIRHIVPMMQQNNVRQLTGLARYFQCIAERYGSLDSNLFDRLFAPIPPKQNPDKENDNHEEREPTLAEYVNARGMNRQSVGTWFRKTQFSRRLKAIRENYPADDEALQSVWNSIIELEDALEKAKKAEDKKAFIEITSELHLAISFYEALKAQERLQKKPKPQPEPLEAVNLALKSEGKDRFPVQGSFDLQAIVMGFDQNANLISAAEKQDTSDGSHRLSKGGGHRYILGDLIISYDLDGHADGAYKLFIKNKKSWSYVDTAIPVQVNDTWMLLCLNRNKKLDKNKWFLVDTEGQWWVLDRKVKGKMPEPTNCPF